MTDKLTDLKNKLVKLEKENKNLQEKLQHNVIETTNITMEMMSNSSVALRVRYEALKDEFYKSTKLLSKIQEECHQLRIEIERLQ